MSKPDQNYTVIREYKNLYDMEELIRRIIRTHIGRIQEGKEKAEGAESRSSHGKQEGANADERRCKVKYGVVYPSFQRRRG